MVFRSILTWARAHSVVVASLLILVVLGLLVLITYKPKTPATSSTASTNNADSGTIKATAVNKSGVLVCLVQAQKGKAPSQCTLTLKADDGKYYTLTEADAKNPKIQSADLDKHIQISGLLTLSQDTSSKITGALAVQTYGELY